MSLNLISSLSFLKSKLGAPHEIKPKSSSSKVDLFAGITESDLDSSSSSSSEPSSKESSRCASPSTGYSTPDARSKSIGPSADILQKCLDILNSDISDSETLPQPDVVKESAPTDLELKKNVEKKEAKSLPQFQGLLKIASPRREEDYPSTKPCKSGSDSSKDSFQHLCVNVSSGEDNGEGSPTSPESPGPPELEPMVSLVTTSLTSTVTTTQTKTVSSCGAPVQSCTTSSITKSIQSVSVPASSLVSTPGADQVQKIFLPPVQPGQAQQIIIQPNPIQKYQTSHVPSVQQSFQNVVNPIQQPIINSVQSSSSSLPQIIQQSQSYLGPHVPTVQIIQSGVPLQLTAGPIPLLGASGNFLGTLAGVSNQATLLNNLQSFTALQQQNQNNLFPPLTQPILQNCINNPQLPIFNHNNVQTNLTPQAKIFHPITIKQEPSSCSVVTPNIVAMSTMSSTSLAPSYQMSSNFTSSAPVIGPSSHPNILALPQTVQPSTTSVAISNGGNPNLISGFPQGPVVLSRPVINVTQPCAGSNSNVSTSRCRSVSATQGPSPMAQLVQDPATGLFNLVSTNAQSSSTTGLISPAPLACSTPAQMEKSESSASSLPSKPLGSTVILPGSPKRLATPTPSSPSKHPKLLLPSLLGSKENKSASSDAPTTKYMCGVCNKYFGNTKNLRVHISEIHEGKRGQFPCDICNKVFPRKRNMERHKNALHLKNNPVCPLCQKVVVNIDVHVKRFHRGSQDHKKVSAATA